MEKIAAIDIGSNAVRLTVAQINGDNSFNILERIRAPLRLGTEAFSNGQTFSKKFMDYAQFTFQELQKTVVGLGVQRCRTVATSAFRDAKNSSQLKNLVEKKSKLFINEIDGNQEASLILRAINSKFNLNSNADYLLFDIGGGSIELSLIESKKIVFSKSIDIGTVRLMEKRKLLGSDEKTDLWIDSKLSKVNKELCQELKKSSHLYVIGTGGNFRRLLKLRPIILGKKPRYVTPEDIHIITDVVESTHYLDCIQKYEFRPDRADVFIPALKVIRKILVDLPVKRVYAPNIGLDQGVLLDMTQGPSPQDQLF